MSTLNESENNVVWVFEYAIIPESTSACVNVHPMAKSVPFFVITPIVGAITIVYTC